MSHYVSRTCLFRRSCSENSTFSGVRIHLESNLGSSVYYPAGLRKVVYLCKPQFSDLYKWS